MKHNSVQVRRELTIKHVVARLQTRFGACRMSQSSQPGTRAEATRLHTCL